jgi:hypothetical protein
VSVLARGGLALETEPQQAHVIVSSSSLPMTAMS